MQYQLSDGSIRGGQAVKLDLVELNKLCKENYKNKTVMAKEMNISRSHLDKIFRNEGVGAKVIEALRIECAKYNFDFDALWEKPPILLASRKASSIDIVDQEDNLLASISSDDVITREDIDVVFND